MIGSNVYEKNYLQFLKSKVNSIQFLYCIKRTIYSIYNNRAKQAKMIFTLFAKCVE